MNILIVSASPRKGGNTELLAEAFAQGASAQHHVEIVSVRDVKVNPCLGCNACFVSESNSCAQKDDMPLIYEKMNHADMLVIASPVYFYGISAQLKAVIDRFHNPIRDSFHIKKMALLLVGAARRCGEGSDFCQGRGRHPDHHDAEDRAEGESHQGHRGLIS